MIWVVGVGSLLVGLFIGTITGHKMTTKVFRQSFLEQLNAEARKGGE